MKKLNQIAVTVLLFGLVAFAAQAQAPYTSLYIFGDGVSTTTNNMSKLAYYYGKRYTNGRTWVEVLAQRLGMGANSVTNVNWSNSANNCSYYGQYSPNLITNINHFAVPRDSNTALFVVWVCDADFVNDMTFVPSTNNQTWNNAINQSLNNHWLIISNLYYNKGARTIIMPNAVDLTEIPQYNGLILSAPAVRNFVRQEIITFNNRFAALLNQAQSSMTANGPLTIYGPDIFSLLDNTLTNAAAYGLTNALNYNGLSTFAVTSTTGPMTNVDGQGANYIFWDATDPSAKMHEVIADTIQQMIEPVQLNGVTVLSPSTAPVYTNQLVVANMPVGLNGFVEGTSNLLLTSWTTVTNFNSVSVTQSIFVNAQPLPPITLPSGTGGSIFPGGGGSSDSQTNQVSMGEVQSYRLRFPYAWSWP